MNDKYDLNDLRERAGLRAEEKNSGRTTTPADRRAWALLREKRQAADEAARSTR